MSLPSRLLGANPSIQVSTLLSGSLSTPSAKLAFSENDYFQIATSFNPGTSVVTFNSIPTDYKFLELRTYHKDARSPVYSGITVRFNNDSGASSYAYYSPQVDSRVGAPFDSSTTASNSLAVPGPGSSASTYYGSSVWKIFDYQSTTKKKVVTWQGGYVGFSDGSSEQGIVTAGSGQWINTAAITRIDVNTSSGNFGSLSRISLYGIKG